MRVDLDHYGVDLAALADCILDQGRHSKRNLVINEHLVDVREWGKLGQEEIESRIRGNPLAVLAAWELADAAQSLKENHQTESEFLGSFNNWQIIKRMVYLCIGGVPDPVPDFHRAIALARNSQWDGLLFLQHVLRWAKRFAHFESYDARGLKRTLLQHRFCAVAADESIAGPERLILDLLEELGIEVVWRSRNEQGSLLSWLKDSLGVQVRQSSKKQELLDFREAGGTPNSLYVVRAMGGVDGFDVRGTFSEDLGLIIDIGDREVSVSSTAYIERHVCRVINNKTSLGAELAGGSLKLRWYETNLQPIDLAGEIHAALKQEFILSTVAVNMIFDPLRISSLKAGIYSYIEDRNVKLRRRSEEGEPFTLCTECSAYAPHAFCIASPDHPPCCGRSYDELSTLAQLTRGKSQMTIKKGICMNRVKGAYIGVDKSAQRQSDGNVGQINLHSIRENPHPTTAIPECIAYYMGDLDLIAVISKDFTGRSPDGKTYDSLLQWTAGMQMPGFVGVSEAYIMSPKFLAQDGGLARVGWMNSSLKGRLKLRVDNIATEKDCINIAGLKEFLSSWKR